MKRYEKMSKEEIIDLFAQMENFCDACRFEKECPTCQDSCYKMHRDYLYKELTPRVTNIHTLEEMKKEKENFENVCRSRWCADCPYKDTDDDCFLVYLYEVEE